MQKVFETVQCASRWSGASGASGPSLPGSEAPDGPPPALQLPKKPPSNDSFLDDTSDTDSDDLYPYVIFC